jgi:hypothetical protein
MNTYTDRLLSFSVRRADRRIAIRFNTIIEISLSVRQARTLARYLNEAIESIKPVIENGPMD